VFSLYAPTMLLYLRKRKRPFWKMGICVGKKSLRKDNTIYRWKRNQE